MADTVSCPKCNRPNGIRRTACMYCSEPLPATDASLATQVPALRQVEEWERGFNLVLAPLETDSPSERQVLRLGEICALDEPLARSVLAARTPLPVLRLATAQEAELVGRLLEAAALRVIVLPDADLALDRPARRLRAVRLDAARLGVHVLWGDWIEIPRDEIALVVEGRITSTRVEIVESAGRERRRELVEAAEYFSEAYVIDIYGQDLETSFRIKADSFDFGCLGGRPAPYVQANVDRLSAALAAYLEPSRHDTRFGALAKLLAIAWPPATRQQSRGLTVRGDFKRHMVSAVETDSLSQFTRYSRMRYVMGPVDPRESGSGGRRP